MKQAVAPFCKELFTASPLPNFLMELYGLVSIIYEFAFVETKRRIDLLKLRIDEADQI